MQSQRGLWGNDGVMHRACTHLGLSRRAWQVRTRGTSFDAIGATSRCLLAYRVLPLQALEKLEWEDLKGTLQALVVSQPAARINAFEPQRSFVACAGPLCCLGADLVLPRPAAVNSWNRSRIHSPACAAPHLTTTNSCTGRVGQSAARRPPSAIPAAPPARGGCFVRPPLPCRGEFRDPHPLPARRSPASAPTVVSSLESVPLTRCTVQL